MCVIFAICEKKKRNTLGANAARLPVLIFFQKLNVSIDFPSGNVLFKGKIINQRCPREASDCRKKASIELRMGLLKNWASE
jgi:hypothetical protein